MLGQSGTYATGMELESGKMDELPGKQFETTVIQAPRICMASSNVSQVTIGMP